MNRITQEEVVAAYKSTGLTFIARKSYDKGCGCPLFAVARARDVVHTIEDRLDCLSASGFARLLNLHTDYACGFVNAVDHPSRAAFDLGNNRTIGPMKEGQEDGLAVLDALRKEGIANV